MKLKKYIINKADFGDDCVIILDEQRKITCTKHQSVFELYNQIQTQNNYTQVKIVTSSLNNQLTAKMNKMNCELYHVNIDDLSNVLYNTNRIPILNQYKFENNILSRYVNGLWENVQTSPIYGISPINTNQTAYLDLLLDDTVNLVMCIGQAGTGKTFLACLAGIFKAYDQNKYDDILITRATVSIGDNSIGFLPGSKEEKMEPWIQPIRDNLKTVLNKKNLIDSRNSVTEFDNYVDTDILYQRGLSKKNKKKLNKMNRSMKRSSRSRMFDKNGFDDSRIKIECISFFRGRSLDNSYCIIDECQNLTSHEIKTIITRIGKNSKLIMLGDDSQSDLKSKSNAYVNAIYSMCDNKTVGVIKLNDTVRSELARLAVKML
jgi:PhoH-like ATPase